MSTYEPGALIVLTYGSGTQVARVRRVTKTGSLVVDRFIPAWSRRGFVTRPGRWVRSSATVQLAKVIGPMLPSDPRAVDAMKEGLS